MLILYCGHLFSPNELANWFQSNVRCPICRYDIREYRIPLYNRNNQNTIFSQPIFTTSPPSQEPTHEPTHEPTPDSSQEPSPEPSSISSLYLFNFNNDVNQNTNDFQSSSDDNIEQLERSNDGSSC